MLSIISGPPEDVIHREQQGGEIGSIILRTSSDLARCEREEIAKIIQQSIADVGTIEHADQAGWFLLADSGVLTDVFQPSPGSLSLCSVLGGGLHGLPWCLAQLNAGKAVLIHDADLLPAYGADQISLKAAEVRSLALLPSYSASLGRTVLILASNSLDTAWSDGIVEQCTLLEDIFSNAYQRGLAQNDTRETGKTELSRREAEVGALASLLIQSQEDERRRLSRELHDDIGQRLSLAASEIALLASQQLGDASISTVRLEGLRDELDSLCTDVHLMSHDLHSYKLQHLGLKSALKDLCRRLSQANFRVDLHMDDFEEPASDDVSLCLYRVAQESLNNALKHAHTKVVAVTITKLQEMFYLTIQDSGIGFDISARSHGLGLVSMSERIKLVNGHFRIHSIPGHGTEVWFSVPERPRLKDFIKSDPSTHNRRRGDYGFIAHDC